MLIFTFSISYFTFIYGPNIPGSYTILLFTASDFTFTTKHIPNWVFFPLWLSLFIPLELFLCSSPVACWALTNLGNYFSVISFCLLIPFMWFSKQEYWCDLLFLSPVGHILSELSTKTCLSWVALHGMAHNFIEYIQKYV